MRKALPFAAVLLLLVGCTTSSEISFDPRSPAVTVRSDGVFFGARRVDAREIASILDDFSVPRDRTIHIRVDKSVRNLSEARFLMGCLAKAGYTRPILVTERQAVSFSVGEKPASPGTWSRDDTP